MPRCRFVCASSLSDVTVASTGSAHCRPSGTVLRVPLERALRLVATSERTIRERERVVRGAPFGKERHGALEMRDRFLVMPFGRRNAPQSELGRGLRFRNATQRIEQPLASLEIPGFEERLGQLHARGQISPARSSVPARAAPPPRCAGQGAAARSRRGSARRTFVGASAWARAYASCAASHCSHACSRRASAPTASASFGRAAASLYARASTSRVGAGNESNARRGNGGGAACGAAEERAIEEMRRRTALVITELRIEDCGF